MTLPGASFMSLRCSVPYAMRRLRFGGASDYSTTSFEALPNQVLSSGDRAARASPLPWGSDIMLFLERRMKRAERQTLILDDDPVAGSAGF